MDIPADSLGSKAKITDSNKHKIPATTPPSSSSSKLDPYKVTANTSRISSIDSVEEQPKSLNDRKASTSIISLKPNINPENLYLDIESIFGKDDVEQLKQLINNDYFEKNSLIPDSKNRTLLHKAAEYGASKCLKMLIEKSSEDLDKKDADGCLPLHLAALKGHTDCIQILIKVNPDALQDKDRFRQTPVLLAARYGKTDSLKAMIDLEQGIEALCIPDDDCYFTPLHWAAKNGDIDSVMAIFEKYPESMGMIDCCLFIPLHHAIEHGHTGCIEFLVKKAPEHLLYRSPNGTPFQLAIKYGHTDVLKHLLDQPIIANKLTEFKSFEHFITDNNKYAELIKNAREKNKIPFKPVKSFDIERFNAFYHKRKNSLAEALTDSHIPKRSKVNKYSATSRLNLNPQIETLPDKLKQAKALLEGLGSVGVYARCKVISSANKEGEFWAMGDASACVKMIKTLAYLGAPNIHVQLSPPDDSIFALRKIYEDDDEEEYNKKQRIALSKLSYLLPEFNINHGTPQEISVFGSKVIISCCDDPTKETPVTFSFLILKEKYSHCGKLLDKNYINLKPYRFHSNYQMMYTDIQDKNCNIIPINAPTNSVLFSLDTKIENDVIKLQLGDHKKTALFDSVNKLCNYSKNKQAFVGVVYGLHHTKIFQDKKIAILTNWLDAIKAKVKKIEDNKPIVIICTANSLDSNTLEKIVETTGVKVVDFSNKSAIENLMPLKSGETVLGVMPSLPQPIFNKLVSNSNLPTLAEGANLTSFLLQNGQPHLSVLPSGDTPVAQDMGYPLEALKAQAFSYKLAISKESEEKNKLENLLKLVKKNKYQEALSFINEIKKDHYLTNLSFLWKTPQPKDIQLKSVTIMSLLNKGENLGNIEKEALISAIAPSEEALANYVESCLNEDSPTTDHFKLQQMHVGQSFNHAVASALVKFGQYKKLLPEL